MWLYWSYARQKRFTEDTM